MVMISIKTMLFTYLISTLLNGLPEPVKQIQVLFLHISKRLYFVRQVNTDPGEHTLLRLVQQVFQI